MLPANIQQPGKWPQRLFAVGGLVCLVLAGASVLPMRDAIAERGYIEATLKQAETQPHATDAARALLAAHKDARAEVARWQRRAFGLALTAVLLLGGALFAAGLRRLHERIQWAVIDNGPEGTDEELHNR